MKRMNLIGCGRVGSTLARLWRESGTFQVQDVLTQGLSSAHQAVEFIGAGRAVATLADMRDADIWMLAVPDREIGGAATALSQLNQSHTPRIGFHCSGALSSTELVSLGQRGWALASAHCLLSFANPLDAMQQFVGTPCALEGDVLALNVLETAFQHIKGNCFVLNEKNKLLYHAAAVFATNFLPVLQATADRLWRDSGMPDALAEQVRGKLLHNAVNNILSLGPAAALTGPAARGDVALVQRQTEALMVWDSEVGEAYKALSQLASNLAPHCERPLLFEQNQDYLDQN